MKKLFLSLDVNIFDTMKFIQTASQTQDLFQYAFISINASSISVNQNSKSNFSMRYLKLKSRVFDSLMHIAVSENKIIINIYRKIEIRIFFVFMELSKILKTKTAIQGFATFFGDVTCGFILQLLYLLRFILHHVENKSR